MSSYDDALNALGGKRNPNTRRGFQGTSQRGAPIREPVVRTWQPGQPGHAIIGGAPYAHEALNDPAKAAAFDHNARINQQLQDAFYARQRAGQPPAPPETSPIHTLQPGRSPEEDELIRLRAQYAAQQQAHPGGHPGTNGFASTALPAQGAYTTAGGGVPHFGVNPRMVNTVAPTTPHMLGQGALPLGLISEHMTPAPRRSPRLSDLLLGG